MISAQRWSHPHNGGQQNFDGMPPQQSFNFQPQQQQFNFQQPQFGQSVGPQMMQQQQQMIGQPRFIPSGQQFSPGASGNGRQRMGNQPQAFESQQQMSQQQPFRPPSSGQFIIQPRQPSMQQQQQQQPQPYNNMTTANNNNNITNMQSPMQSQFNNNPMLSPQFNNKRTQPSSSFRPSSMSMQPQQHQMQPQFMQQQQQQMQPQFMQQQQMQQQQLQQQQMQQQQNQRLQMQQQQFMQQQQRGQQIPQPTAMPPPAAGTDQMPTFTLPRVLSNTTEYTNTTGPNSSPVKKSFSRYRATKLASVSVTFFDATYPPEATIGVSLDEAKLAYTVNDSVNIRNIPVCAIAVNSQNDSIQAGGRDSAVVDAAVNVPSLYTLAQSIHHINPHPNTLSCPHP